MASRAGVAAALLDLLLLAAAIVVLFVALTGGGLFHAGAIRIRLTSTTNPMAIAGIAALARYLLFRTRPFVWAPGRRPMDLERGAESLQRRFTSPLPPGEERQVFRWLAVIMTASVVVRLFSAWAYPGFVTGDDVEIHEMTLAVLLEADWPVWDLRSAFYPMTFIFPLQALVHRLGGAGVEGLVLAGRIAVIVVATLSIWLVYRVARRLSDSAWVALAAAGLFASSRLHLWYGSSELPRPVASAFLLGAFWLLLGERRSQAIAAGALLGIGAALRFGEVVFFAPAVAQLALRGRRVDALLMAATGGATALLSVGLADWLYWGRPWSSTLAIFDYTLIQRESSRGFQPPWFYASGLHEWTNLPYLLLGALALRRTDARPALWAWLPLLLLSLLPHKEARYAVPVLPFLCLAAALTLQDMMGKPLRRQTITIALLAVAIAMTFEASNWRPRRTNAEVEVAKRIASLRPGGVAAEQLWRFGGRLYLKDVGGSLIDVHGDLAPALAASPAMVLLRHESIDSATESALEQAGYVPEPDLGTRAYRAWRRERRTPGVKSLRE